MKGGNKEGLYRYLLFIIHVHWHSIIMESKMKDSNSFIDSFILSSVQYAELIIVINF